MLIAADEIPSGLPAVDTFVVGYPKGGEVYEAVGGCFQSHGNCALQSSYKGWPIYIGFEKTYACGVIDVIKRVHVVLDRFLLNETPAGPATPTAASSQLPPAGGVDQWLAVEAQSEPAGKEPVFRP